jgi:hypothetical protein
MVQIRVERSVLRAQSFTVTGQGLVLTFGIVGSRFRALGQIVFFQG